MDGIHTVLSLSASCNPSQWTCVSAPEVMDDEFGSVRLPPGPLLSLELLQVEDRSDGVMLSGPLICTKD